MDPMASLDVEGIRWMHIIYFAGGIAVILLGAIGTVLVILGILQAKILKPYKNRYPYEEFKSFEEFVFKKPAQGERAHFNETYTHPKDIAETKEDTPVLTWENANQFIPNLTSTENKEIEKMVEEEYEEASNM